MLRLYGFWQRDRDWIAQHPEQGMPFPKKKLYQGNAFFEWLTLEHGHGAAQKIDRDSLAYAEMVPDEARRERIFGRHQQGLESRESRRCSKSRGRPALTGQPVGALGRHRPFPISIRSTM